MAGEHMTRFGFRFADKAAFGGACMALSRAGHTYSLAGFQTIVLSEGEIRALDPSIKSLLETGPPKVEKFLIERHGKRPAPPDQATVSRLLQEFTKR